MKIFGKVILAMALFAASAAANAITVNLIVHNQTSGSGAISSLITDGSHVQPAFVASTAVFDWDGVTLSSTGLYAAVSSLGSGIFGPTVIGDEITDLNIDTSGAGSAGGSVAYKCVEGTFLAGVGANGCGGYTIGTNFADQSTTIWSGLTVAQTIGGDDVSTAGPRTISAYDFGTFTLISGVDGQTPGDVFSIGNGLALGVPNLSGEAMQFQVVPVPAAAWLFGSALGLLGWARRRVVQ